jgi:hypothetical protein
MTLADRAWLEELADKDWPSPSHFGEAFAYGLVTSVVLYHVVFWIMKCLKYWGGVSGDNVGLEPIALSETFAGIEQFIFYLAAIAGTQVFGFAVGGWFLLKAVSNYTLWDVPTEQRDNRIVSALAHNRRQIFLIGTLMSVAAGGLAGVIYHLTLHAISD